jgi:hypothetical protein
MIAATPSSETAAGGELPLFSFPCPACEVFTGTCEKTIARRFKFNANDL